MAIPRNYETLMLQKEAKDKFRKAKQHLEKRMGMELSHSQAMIMMCNELLLGSKSWYL